LSKVKLHNDLIVSILLVILVFSISSSISLVKADAGGTGKYLGIIFTVDPSEDITALREQSGCYVIATKVTSQQQFIFNASDETDGEPISLIKVAAGTVELTAHTTDSWGFSHFEYYDTGETLGLNGSSYKTEKYGTVAAEFYKIETVDITISILTEFEVPPDETYTLGFGSVSYDYGNGYETIVSNPPESDVPVSITIPVLYSSTPTFKFTAADGNDLSCVIVSEEEEGGSTYYADFIETVHGEVYEYTLPPVTTNLELDAIFYGDGEAFIPGGTGVTIFLRSQEQDASLSFLGTVGTGFASGTYIATGYDGYVVWNITVAADLGDDLVLVALKYPDDMDPADALALRIWRTDSDLVAYDLNSDGRIDGQDVKLVSNRLIEPIPDYDETYDFVFDGVIDSADVNFISNLAGSKIVWEDITSPYIGNLPAGAPDGLVYPVDTENNIVYGFTGHFSIFRGR
jgi:hypothetical protein